MILKAAYWSLCTYLVFKLIQHFLVIRPGFGTAEPRLREKLLRGEPLVFIVACAIAIAAALGSSWYLEHGYQRGLHHAVDCYGRLGALRHLPDVETRFDALEVFRSVRAARQAASLAARSLELAPANADRLTAEKVRFYTRQYSTVTRQGDRQAMRTAEAAIGRCMSEPLINF